MVVYPTLELSLRQPITVVKKVEVWLINIPDLFGIVLSVCRVECEFESLYVTIEVSNHRDARCMYEYYSFTNIKTGIADLSLPTKWHFHDDLSVSSRDDSFRQRDDREISAEVLVHSPSDPT